MTRGMDAGRFFQKVSTGTPAYQKRKRKWAYSIIVGLDHSARFVRTLVPSVFLSSFFPSKGSFLNSWIESAL